MRPRRKPDLMDAVPEFGTLPELPLWRDRSFVLFWLARAVSIAGTAITTVVLPILVFRLTGSALLTSSLAALEVIPYLLFGLFAGAITDRVDRRRLMVVSDLLNLVLLASIPVAARLNVLTIAQIYAVGLLSATAFVWFDTLTSARCQR
jgi:MFS family permease